MHSCIRPYTPKGFVEEGIGERVIRLEGFPLRFDESQGVVHVLRFQAQGELREPGRLHEKVQGRDRFVQGTEVKIPDLFFAKSQVFVLNVTQLPPATSVAVIRKMATANCETMSALRNSGLPEACIQGRQGVLRQAARKSDSY